MTRSKSVYLSAHFFHLALLLFIVEFVRGAFVYSFLPVFAVEKLGFTVTIVGLAITAHSLMDLFVKSVIGMLLDHFPFRKVVSLSMFIAFFGLLWIPFVHTEWQLLLSVSLFGLGISPIWLVSMGQVDEEFRGTQMGLLYSFWLIGTGLGMVSTNFILDLESNLALWGFMIIWLMGSVSSLWIRETKNRIFHVESLKEQYEALKGQLKVMKPLLPGMILQTMAAGMLLPILPDFISKHLGFTYSTYSYILMVGGGLAMAGLIPMGRLADHWGKKWFLVMGFAFLSLALFLIPLSNSFWMVLFLTALLGISYSAVLPSWNALLAQYVPVEYKGMGWGLFSSVEGLGVLIGPALGGWLADRFTSTFIVVLSAILLGSIAIFYFLYPMKFDHNRRIK
ncbi:MFS transporter [Thermicanus aegyptius]|uniref:MFS transporter n=1 Tax=Thermicanus aegyptius TaxID=94009 RepID=UPI00041E98F0|nr:MFS transporter [Thermicanus aegyptius]